MRLIIGGAAIVLVLAASGLSRPVFAAAFDGSAPMLCASVTVMECDAKGACDRRTPDEVNLPVLVRVDIAGKTVATLDGSRSAEVKAVTRLDGRLILQGAQNGRGWNIAIVEETGKMSAAVADGEDAFVVYGTCALAGR